MITYNLYFTPKAQVSHSQLLGLAHQFANQLIELGLVQAYGISRVTNVGNFESMPEYAMSVHFKSANHMQQSFAEIRERHMHSYPHSELMAAVAEFKVTFSESVNA